MPSTRTNPTTAARPLRFGIIGCGNISSIYLANGRRFARLEPVAVADLDDAKARARAAEHGVDADGIDALLARDDIDAVVNLTVPHAHATVSRAILEAGKHAYTEKPLATNRDDGLALLELAQAKGLRIGSAPDTFLGGGLQTARAAIDSGLIGRPVAATAFMTSHGPESWHPNPAFFFEPGAGPLFDMGPYYLTALVTMLGPMRSVTGSASTGLPERPIGSEPLRGTVIRPTTPTHVTAALEFDNGAVATLLTSFDIWASELPRLEIYGTEGTLSLPDPNTFGGPLRVRLAGEREWRELDITRPYTGNSRGVGLADLAHATWAGRPERASGELAMHVLDAMQAILESAERRAAVDLATRCARPAALPEGLEEGLLDDAVDARLAEPASGPATTGPAAGPTTGGTR